MSHKFSKVKVKCLEAIRKNPGILQCKLYRMGIAHRSDIGRRIFSLCYEGSVVRIHDIAMNSYRLYPKGKEPQTIEKEKYHNRVHFFGEFAHTEINKGHGDKFYRAFDEAYGLLYIELKILGMAAPAIR
jgi:hypothetical protein